MSWMPGCVKTRNRKGNDVLGHLARLDRQIDHIARVRQLQGYVATEISRVLKQLVSLKRPETADRQAPCTVYAGAVDQVVSGDLADLDVVQGRVRDEAGGVA